MNFGTKLHDTKVSLSAAQEALNELNVKYGFEDYRLKISDSENIQYSSIIKNELIVAIMVARKTAYELFFHSRKGLWDTVKHLPQHSKVY